MNISENMHPVEQLYAFMDGELDPVFEQQLFGELAANQELRTEMKDLLAMKEAVCRDVLAPPVAVRDRMLTAVGFAGSGAAVAGGLWSSVRSAVSSAVAPVLGVAFGAAVTALLMQPEKPIIPLAAGLKTDSDKPLWTLILPQKSQPPEIRYVNCVIEQAPWRAETSSGMLSGVPLSDNSAPPAAVEETARVIASDAIAADLSQTTDLPAVPENIGRTESARQPEQGGQGFSVRLRGLFNKSYPASNISYENTNWLDNAAFGAAYRFSPSVAAGIEIGMERFAQVFGSADGASEVWYEQNPQMLWGGVFVQYKLAQLEQSTDLHLYGETLAGAAGTLGFLGRQSFGLSFSPWQSLTFSAAGDAAILPYVFKGQWFSTEKFGVTLGVSFYPDGL